MKPTTVLVCAAASLVLDVVVAQPRPEDAPWTLPREDLISWSGPREQYISLTGTADAIVLGLTEFYESAQGVAPSNVNRRGNWNYLAQLLFSVKQEDRFHGWRAKAVNVTASFSMSSTVKAGVRIYAGQRWDAAGQELLTEFESPTVYASTGNTTFTTTLFPKARTWWGPCTGAPDWKSSGWETVAMNFLTYVDLVNHNQTLVNGTAWLVSAGRPGSGNSDFLVHYNLEWERCDPSKKLADTLGRD